MESQRVPSAPSRLALQSGELDDHRRQLTHDDDLWDVARRCHAARHDDCARQHDHADLKDLCERWPRESATGCAEACAVTVALAAPFASRERVLRALTAHGFTLDELRGDGEPAPILIAPGTTPRPRFPYVFDPDTEQRAPIVAMLDGPRSLKVAEMMEAIKQHDETLAEAMVLGADLETLEMLERLSRDATRAARRELAAHVDQDRAHWRQRAEQARARQRLEGTHYGWHGDNFPRGCLEAARAEHRHEVEVLLEHPPG